LSAGPLEGGAEGAAPGAAEFAALERAAQAVLNAGAERRHAR
jgi:hypothetical protein